MHNTGENLQARESTFKGGNFEFPRNHPLPRLGQVHAALPDFPFCDDFDEKCHTFDSKYTFPATFKCISCVPHCISSLGLLYKLLQTGGLKATEIYPITVLEARSPRARCWQGPSLCLSSQAFPSLCPCPNFPLLIRTPVTG